MGMSSTLNPCGNGAQIVDKLLGEAYETVRNVAVHIEYVKHVSLHMEQLYRVFGSIEAIDTLNENIAKLDTLHANLTAILAVEAIKTDITTVSANLAMLQTINTNLVKIQAVYENLADINTVAADIVAIRAVAAQLTPLLAVYAKLTELLYVHDNMDTFLAELATLSAMDGRIDALETLTASHSTAISGIDTELDNIGTTLTAHGQAITDLGSNKQDSSTNLTELSAVNPGTAGKQVLAAEDAETILTAIGAFDAENVIDDDTFATASATNVPSAESVKVYADKKADKDALLTFVGTYDWASIAAGAMASTTFTVTGAALGDIVLGASLSVAVAAGVMMTAHVTAANTVTVSMVNHTAAAVDIASASHRIVVLKKANWGLTS